MIQRFAEDGRPVAPPSKEKLLLLKMLLGPELHFIVLEYDTLLIKTTSISDSFDDCNIFIPPFTSPLLFPP
jgi:hypothetical protein